MSDGLVPQRYAKALYKYALEKDNTRAVYEEMKAVISSFQANPSLQKVLSNPFVSRADKQRLLLAAAGDRKESDFEAFVKLVCDHNREEFAWQMALEYRRLYRDANKISQVDIITAAPMGEEELNQLEGVVKRAFPDRTLEFTSSVNPEIIGGFVIVVDNTKMDASISNELQQLRQKLLRK